MANFLIDYVIRVDSGAGLDAVQGLAAFLPGPMRKFVDAMAQVTRSLVSMAEALADYSVELFAAKTDFEFFMEGLKYDLADAFGPLLSNALDLVKNLLEQLARILKSLLPILEALLWLFEKFVALIALVIYSLQLLGGILTKIVATLIEALDWLVFGIIDDDWIEALHKLADNWVKVGTEGIEEAMKRIMGFVDESVNEKEQLGHQLSLALINSMKAWSFLSRGHGPLPGTTNMGRDVMINPNTMRADSPIDASIARTRDGEGGLPRPDKAAMHLHIAESVKISAADEDRLFTELLMFKNEVMDQVRGLNDNRWLRLMVARHRITKGIV